MGKLIAFGCSTTYGQSLSDIHPHNKQPSKLAWPQILGDLTNMPVLNMAKMGSSNKEIAHYALNYNYSIDDIAVICWTYKDRFCIVRKDDILRLGVWHTDPKFPNFNPNKKENQQVSKQFYEYVYDDYDMLLNAHCCIHYTDLFLKSKKIKCYHLMAHNYLNKEFEFFNTSILAIDYEKLYNENPLALDNMHSGENTHKLLATEIFNQTKGLTIEYDTNTV